MSHASALMPLAAVVTAFGQPWVVYDASLGTLPDEQCWEFVNQRETTPGRNLVELVDGTLYFSTMPGPPTNPPTQWNDFVFGQRTDVSIDFADSFEMQAEIHLVTGQVNIPPSGWLRPGFLLVAVDSHGRWLGVGLGDDRVYLWNDAYAGATSISSAPFPVAGRFHTFRLRVEARNAHLAINGVWQLSVPIGRENVSSGPRVRFGDGTVWAGSEAFVRHMRFSGEAQPCCHPDCDTSTGPGILDIFDFLCFGSKFAAGEPYACDFDMSTGPGICDIFDFIAFQNAFAAGCP